MLRDVNKSTINNALFFTGRELRENNRQFDDNQIALTNYTLLHTPRWVQSLCQTNRVSQLVAALVIEWFRMLILYEKRSQSQLVERHTVASCDDICHHSLLGCYRLSSQHIVCAWISFCHRFCHVRLWRLARNTNVSASPFKINICILTLNREVWINVSIYLVVSLLFL